MSTQAYSTEQQAYAPGFHMTENYVFKSERGLSTKIVEQISEMKGEPDWMRKFRRPIINSHRSTARCGAVAALSMCQRACVLKFPCRPTSVSMPRTWVSSSAR